jgi:hypothetical protein
MHLFIVSHATRSDRRPLVLAAQKIQNFVTVRNTGQHDMCASTELFGITPQTTWCDALQTLTELIPAPRPATIVAKIYPDWSWFKAIQRALQHLWRRF